MHRLSPLLLAALLLAAALRPDRARAGEWHAAQQLVCSDCHTMHNSSAGQPMRYDADPNPGQHLLRGANSIALCLFCHDGTKPYAPDVLAPVTYVADSAAGFFPSPVGAPSTTSHNLAIPGVTATAGGPPMTLTCVSCHDPHGSPNYRNLQPNPSRSGAPGVSVTGASFLWPGGQRVVANGGNPTAVYPSTNVIYGAGMTAWCADCHTGYPQSHAHPADKSIQGSPFTDFAGWSLGDRVTALLADPVTGVRTRPVRRVPVQNPLDAVVPSVDDQVFCLSCHKAHGSSNPFAQIWPDGTSLDSACQQCHPQ